MSRVGTIFVLLLLSGFAHAGERAHEERAFNWKLAASSAFLVGADVFDQQTTLRGLKAPPGCVEANVGGPHPSAARLYGQNLPIDAGLIALGYLLRRKHAVIVPYAPLLAAGAHHLSGGIAWYTSGCL
jgi:hypothetical protein